jgi:hypothetical protein
MSEAENELFTAVRLAISDPGSVLPRDRHGQYAELVTHWGARAVMEVIRERAAEVERERDELRAAVTRVRLLIDQPNPRYVSIAPSVILYALDGTDATDE